MVLEHSLAEMRSIYCLSLVLNRHKILLVILQFNRNDPDENGLDFE